MSTFKQRLALALPPLVTVLIIGVVVREATDRELLLQSIKRAEVRWIALAIILTFVNVTFSAARWRTVLAACGYALSLRRALTVVLAVWPVSALTPSRAGDLARAFCVRREVPLEVALGAVVTEKVIDIQLLCLVAGVASFARGFTTTTWIAVSLAAAFWVAIAVVYFVTRNATSRVGLLGKLKALGETVHSLRNSRKHLVITLGLTALMWCNVLAIAGCLLAAFHASVPILTTASLWPLALFAGVIPITLSGMGTRDAAFVFLVQATSSTAHTSAILAATLTYSLITTWLVALVGVPFMFRQKLIPPDGRPRDAAESC